MRFGGRARACIVLAFASRVVACRGAGVASDVPDAGLSPQARAEPAELENVAVTSSAQPPISDAGAPPVPLRSDERAASDTLWKESTGWEMEATLRTLDIPPAFRGPETAIAAVDAVKKKADARLLIDMAGARLRVELASVGFVLPEGTELRARADRYGAFLSIPEEQPRYRIAPPGSLRALLGERRIDVEPLVPAGVVERGEGGRRLGYRTRRVEVTNRAASATFELARVTDGGEGGVLLCRALLDLLNAPPFTPVCGADEIPVHVEWRWTKGGLVFDATDLSRRTDLAPSVMSAPPLGASFVGPSLPELSARVLVDPSEIVAFRTGPADVPSSPAPRSASLRDAAASPVGLTLVNASDELRVAWLDGAPVAWVAPGGSVSFPTLLRGRYGFAWRTFLGDAYDAPITLNVPAVVTAGAADAGSP
jgi:hypothetical protein